jgi:calcineurin-like phosphoesterase family protein
MKYDNRPFLDVENMNEQIIHNWNLVIGKNDIIFHLGDLAFANRTKIEEILQRLNGKKYLIFGNHDNEKDYKNYLSKYFEFIGNYLEISVLDKNDKGEEYYQLITLCHYPLTEWNKNHYKSWNLHGHCHGNNSYKQNYQLDVGVNNHEYFPISYNQIKEILINNLK